MDKWNPRDWLDTTALDNYVDTEDVTSPAGRKLLEQAGLIYPQPKLSSYTGSIAPASFDKDLDGLSILDNGAGLAQLTEVLVDELKAGNRGGAGVSVGDTDESLLGELQKRKEERGWDMVEIKRLDAMALDIPDESLDFVFGNFLYFLLPDSLKGLKESIRTLKPGGTLGFTTWAYSAPFHLLQHAQSLLPSYPLVPPFPSGQWGHPRFVQKSLQDLGLVDIKVEPYEFVQSANSAAEMSMKMRVVVKLVTSQWGDEKKELGWKMFEKIEEILTREQGSGPVSIRSVALIVTAKKA